MSSLSTRAAAFYHAQGWQVIGTGDDPGGAYWLMRGPPA